MNIISKIDNIIVAPFQRIVSFLNYNNKDTSFYLVVMTIVSFLMFILAEILQIYVNFCFGYNTVGYTKYIGIKTLETKDLYWNVLPFLIAIILSFTIRHYNEIRNSKWDFFFASFMNNGQIVGFQMRMFYMFIFILTLYDVGELETVKTLWNIINRNIMSYHYVLGLASVFSIVFCILSFFILAISMFFMGCDYSEK